MTRVRDLLVFDDLVIACDSVGGIGPKPGDTVLADAVTVAHFAVRVPLLEVICSGATPIVLVDALCVERNPTGEEMIAEVLRQAFVAGIPADAVTGSTEDNVPTQATGIGTVVLGRLPAQRSITGAWAGDAVVCLGRPVSAPRDDVRIGHPAIIPLDSVQAVLATGLVHDALPVGSRGLAWEVPQLAASAGLDVVWVEPPPIDREDSGGPSSCVVVACDPADVAAVVDAAGVDVPCAVVAHLSELT